MATINPSIRRNGDGSVIVFTYADMADGDDGAPIRFPEWADRSVQVKGTFGTGGNLRFEGSNDEGTTYFTLTDPQGNAIDLTAAGGKQVTEIAERSRPRVTAGDGATSLTVIVTCRRQQQLRV